MLAPSVQQHLMQEIQRSEKALAEQLLELQNVLERVVGIKHWIRENLEVMQWCQQTLDRGERAKFELDGTFLGVRGETIMPREGGAL